MPSPVNILLVDDQPRNLDALEAVLDTPDYRLVRAESADAALLALLKDDFAALILDVKMPGMNGLELAQVIKRRKRTRHVPILFLTAHVQEDHDVLLAYGAGGADYLSKPFNPQVLRSKIAAYAELFRKTRALARANVALEEEIAERQKAQEALRLANAELEARVQERTADLTHINQALEQAKAEAEAANAAKDHFLAVLSHELRTPLTPVLITVQLLEDHPALDREAREALATVRRNVELEARLIDDLLDLTLVARGKLTLNLQDVDLGAVVRQAMETCSPEAAGKKVRLVLDSAPGDARMTGDPARLQQVFWNLIKNAVKFTPANGQVSIRCHGEQTGSGQQLAVSVRDTGVGISQPLLSRIFDAFEQGDRNMARRFGGLGLGLAISKALVEMHGGTIVAQSAGRDKGAAFTVRLPAGVHARGAPSRPALPSAEAPDADRTVLHVLLVEDHVDSARVLVRLLRRFGYKVTHAKDMAAALRIARRGRFDLLISDLGLPDGSGHDLMRQLAADAPIKGIALSGYGMEADIACSREAGFLEHLTKPVTIEQLQAAIERVSSQAPGAPTRREDGSINAAPPEDTADSSAAQRSHESLRPGRRR